MLSNEEESDQCSVDSDPSGEGWETGIGARDLPGSPRKEVEFVPDPVEACAGREPRDHGDGGEIGAATPARLEEKE